MHGIHTPPPGLSAEPWRSDAIWCGGEAGFRASTHKKETGRWPRAGARPRLDREQQPSGTGAASGWNNRVELLAEVGGQKITVAKPGLGDISLAR